MVRCCTAASLRVENLDNCTSGIPVMSANTPLAVPKVGEKQRLKNTPSFAKELKYGVLLSGLPLMLLLYMLKLSQMTSTIFGRLSGAPLSGCMVRK